MPRVPQHVIDSVFYLYANGQDAIDGKTPGGTGFVASVTEFAYNRSFEFHYGVTNWHVSCQAGCSVIRLNRLDGECDIVEKGPEDWHFIAGRQDVAVVALDLDRRVHKTGSVNTSLFAAKPSMRQLSVGDDVFMLGLFVDHVGTTTNNPSARFGHISMMPDAHATIEQPTTYRGESFVLDLHSRTGYSGSPVFVFRTPLADLGDPWPRLQGHVDAGLIAHQLRQTGFAAEPRSHEVSVEFKLPRTLFALLGIHWAQFPERWEIKNPDLIGDAEARAFVTNGAYVSGLSGMTCVIPAWEIKEVLDLPDLKEKRYQQVRKRAAGRG